MRDSYGMIAPFILSRRSRLKNRFYLSQMLSLATLTALAVLIAGCGSTGASGGSVPSPTVQSSSSLMASPLSVQFGNVPVGTAVSQTLTFSNSIGSSSNVTVSSLQVTGTGFSLVQAPSIPAIVAPGQSASLKVQVLPSTPGALSGTITVVSDATPSTVTVKLSATGITTTGPTFNISGTLSPASLNLGATMTITGPGIAPSTVTPDSNGNYTFLGLSNGSYTVTPAKSNATFAPAAQQVTVNNANVTGINFAAAFGITGSLGAGGNGATVALSGTSSATVTADASGNFSFSSLPNGTFTITPTKAGYTFVPANSQATIANANVTGMNFTISAGQISISPPSFTFSSSVGIPSQSQSAILGATGGDVTVTSDTLNGAGFGIGGLTFPLTVKSGQSVPFSVTFSPASAGNVSGTLSFGNGSTSLATANLSGTGVGLSVDSASLNFGPVLDGTISASQTITLSAVGAGVTITSSNLTQNGGGGSALSVSGLPTFPLNLAVGQTAQFTATFAPASNSPGTAAGTLTFASNLNNVSEALSGTGISNVLLSWSPSTTPNVTYNAYRCSISASACVQGQPGNFSRIANAVGVLTYTDATVSSGQTYYYAVTAMDNTGAESIMSIVPNAAVIP